MTQKALLELKKQYVEMLRSKQDYLKEFLLCFCRQIAENTDLNHHERGQQLWALFQAEKELRANARGD